MGGVTPRAFEPYDGLAAVRRILDSRCTLRRKVGLLLVLEGMSYREAERLTGGRQHPCLFRNAKRLGVDAIHNRRRRERSAWLCSASEAAAVDAVNAGTATPKQALMAIDRAHRAADRIMETTLDEQD